jgi:hypothetical protein
MIISYLVKAANSAFDSSYAKGGLFLEVSLTKARHIASVS